MKRLQMQRSLFEENKALKAENERLREQVKALTEQLRTQQQVARKDAEQRQLLAKWGVK